MCSGRIAHQGPAIGANQGYPRKGHIKGGGEVNKINLNDETTPNQNEQTHHPFYDHLFIFNRCCGLIRHGVVCPVRLAYNGLYSLLPALLVRVDLLVGRWFDSRGRMDGFLSDFDFVVSFDSFSNTIAIAITPHTAQHITTTTTSFFVAQPPLVCSHVPLVGRVLLHCTVAANCQTKLRTGYQCNGIIIILLLIVGPVPLPLTDLLHPPPF